MRWLKGLFWLALALSVGCGLGGRTQERPPPWLDELIERLKKDPPANPPAYVAQYEYQGRTVYYVPPRYADEMSTLYDAEGNVLCAPDGGYIGVGDGKCPDFFDKRQNEKILWRDTRTPGQER